MRHVHIIYAVDDGITTLRCGVGAIAVNFIKAFPEILDYYTSRGIHLRLSIISFSSDLNVINRRDDLYDYAKSICRSTGGRVYLITRKSNKVYFDFRSWKDYNNEANRIISSIAKANDFKTVVLANDTIFSHLRCQNGIIQIWIPHSLSLIHSQTYVDNQARLLWEKSAIDYHKRYAYGFIGYISPFVKQTLKDLFNINENKLLPFLNGFCLSFIRNQYRYSDQQIKSVLLSRNIPINKPLLFTFARADEYKGLETSLRVMKEFTKQHHYQGVLIASRFNDEAVVDNVQRRLLKLHKSNDNINLFLGYEFELPKYLLRYRLTKILLNLPSRDFCPLVPFEAELIGYSKLWVINSDLDCFRGLINDHQNGFLINPSYPRAIENINALIRLSLNNRLKIIKEGRKRTRKLFDIRRNYIKGFEYLFNKKI